VIAFLFPGQGSQKVGMGAALAQAYPEARAVFAEADAALGFSLSKLCFEGPVEELTLTANAQPAILATSIAALRALGPDPKPGVVAGHSLGEYSALVAAGALRLADAVRVVNLRGKFMQEAVAPGEGAMAAIVNLDRPGVEAACARAAEQLSAVVSPANHNGGGQIVIAGTQQAVSLAGAFCKEAGAKVIPLKVSAPFHCALMKPAADRLAAELARIELVAPAVPVVTNVEAAPSSDPARLKALLIEQVTAPVRWEESVRRMVAMGATRAVELGAGNVLAGLVKRFAPELPVQGSGEPEAIQALKTGGA
jgi:[acyl-carrier-protein] S-malonyltransferase